MTPPLYSFNTPCLRWKLLIAYKGQNGWPGFLFPNATRYLAIIITVTNDPSGLYRFDTGEPLGLPITTNAYPAAIDRITGRPLPGGTPGLVIQFPYGLDLVQEVADNPGSSWQAEETYFKHVIPRTLLGVGGVAYTIIEAQLCNPYTTEQLNADADALINGMDPAAMPWMTARYAQNEEISPPLGPYTPLGDLTQSLPTGTIGFFFNGSGPIPVPKLGAAAWQVFTPGFVGAGNWFPNGYLKAIGYVAMAGNYCKKTFLIDYNQNPLNQFCVSGHGSCADPFKLTPPPLDPGELPLAPGKNAYIEVVPNCQCGG